MSPANQSGPSPHPWGTQSARDGGHDLGRSIPTPVGNTAAPRRWRCPPPVHPHTRGEHQRASRSPAPEAVHPHTRGEHVRRRGGAAVAHGPSPHPWGTRVAVQVEAAGGRSIPTPVGNTSTARRRRRGPAVHPHTRGEHVPGDPSPGPDTGPSPHPWGTLPGVHELDGRERSIPTPVGNTGDQAPSRSPRPGPSPHPWGTHRARARARARHRSIPTPVGNTRTPRQQSASGTVHPHTRGEHTARREVPEAERGPSPHPWGTLRTALTAGQQRGSIPTPVGNTHHRHGQQQRLRSIPTPVGNTPQMTYADPAGAVHPHTRGEHRLDARQSSAGGGPSPHPWGTRARATREQFPHRSIPTPVGNTPRPPKRPHRWTVHPHTRGEHAELQTPPTTANGPSPHPWGTPPHPRG